MIIVRTPFRISFFGGGTDYPAWFREHGGAVLATTIDKYCYISCRHLPPFFEHKSRIVWSHIELVHDNKDILHPAVKAALAYLKVPEGVEILHHGDLPARSGLGSSSSFTVGLLHALHALRGNMPSKRQLAREAIEMEQDVMCESVGCQDQVLAAHGGFQKIEFRRDGGIVLEPVVLARKRVQELQSHLLLLYTGKSRSASNIAASQIESVGAKEQELHTLRQTVDEALAILGSDADIGEFGRLLDKAWQIKRGLTTKITTPLVDSLYEKARAAGALGGKLLGAGGGGFFLVFARPADHECVKQALKEFLHVPFRFENSGTQVLFYEQNGFSESEA